jgi:ATP-dependent DNA helicase RecG
VPDTIKDSADKVPITKTNRYTEQQIKILRYVAKNGKITTKEAESILQVKQRRARDILCQLVKDGILDKVGTYKSTIYVMEKMSRWTEEQKM